MKVTVGANMVAVLVGVNHQIDVSYFEPDLKKPPFEHRKISIAAGIDHHIFVVALDNVAVTAPVQTADLKNSRLKFGYRRTFLHWRLVPFAFHGALKITVNLKLFGKAIVLKIALQAGTQAAEAQNAGSLIHFLFERKIGRAHV